MTINLLTVEMNALGNYRISYEGAGDEGESLDRLLSINSQQNVKVRAPIRFGCAPREKERGAKFEENGTLDWVRVPNDEHEAPSPHHHINVQALQATIQPITNEVWLNRSVLSKNSGRLWQSVYEKEGLLGRLMY